MLVVLCPWVGFQKQVYHFLHGQVGNKLILGQGCPSHWVKVANSLMQSNKRHHELLNWGHILKSTTHQGITCRSNQMSHRQTHTHRPHTQTELNKSVLILLKLPTGIALIFIHTHAKTRVKAREGKRQSCAKYDHNIFHLKIFQFHNSH